MRQFAAGLPEALCSGGRSALAIRWQLSKHEMVEESAALAVGGKAMATMTVQTSEKIHSADGPNTAKGSFWRWTGVFGLAVVALSWAQFPLYSMGGTPPAYNGAAYAQHLYNSQTAVFTRILLDLGLYVAFMIFAARLAYLVREARRESSWLGTLLFGAAAVWIGVTLVANGLEGGAALDTLKGNADASAVRALIDGTLPIYNGPIAFVITALFVGAAGYATFSTGILPRWTGWIAYLAAALCVISVPAIYAGPLDYGGFYNAGGWGPAIIANFPPLIWFLVVGIVMVRRKATASGAPGAEASRLTQ